MSITRPTRFSSPCRTRGSIRPSSVRSIAATQVSRLVTSGRPIASTIRPRCGCTTMSRTDCDAALPWYSSPVTTWR